jgi:hypothetical protein
MGHAQAYTGVLNRIAKIDAWLSSASPYKLLVHLVASVAVLLIASFEKQSGIRQADSNDTLLVSFILAASVSLRAPPSLV